MCKMLNLRLCFAMQKSQSKEEFSIIFLSSQLHILLLISKIQGHSYCLLAFRLLYLHLYGQ
jgi:hypothetical protein